MSIYRRTVQFPPRPVADIFKALEQYCDKAKASIVIIPFYDDGDGYELGVCSAFPYQNFRLDPEGDSEGTFRKGESYTRLFVSEYRWSAPVHPVGYTDQMIIDSGHELAEALQRALGGEDS